MNRREALVGMALVAAGAKAAEPPRGEPNATEDLMREHGVIRRTLFVYHECAMRLSHADPLPRDTVTSAARLIQRFAEGYHEKLEEQQVFPRLEKSHGPLVKVLLEQHAAGRKLTERILGGEVKKEPLFAFVKMYGPHAAWEDTELFPAFHALFSEQEFDAIGDQFEELEHKLLGAGGFEGALREVQQLERALGIDDLSRFTAR